VSARELRPDFTLLEAPRTNVISTSLLRSGSWNVNHDLVKCSVAEIFGSMASSKGPGLQRYLREEHRRKPSTSNRRQVHNYTAKGPRRWNADPEPNKLKILSWRTRAYRQPAPVSVEFARKEPGTYGMLVLMDEAVRLPLQPPMTWISPLNETSNERALFHYCEMTATHVSPDYRLTDAARRS
jgi:hypothetical protein